MTKMSTRLGTFADVKLILDEAIASGGGEYVLASHGEAVHWRQRAYKFRKLYGEQFDLGTTPYDQLYFPRIPKESSTVVIQIRRAKGFFQPFVSRPQDDLEEQAAALRRKIDEGDIL